MPARPPADAREPHSMKQTVSASLIDGIRQAWQDNADLRPHAGLLDLHLDNGVVTVTGEVPRIAAKKRAVSDARALCGRVADRVRVTPRQPMTDREISDLLFDAFAGEPVFRGMDVRRRQAPQRSFSDDQSAIAFAVQEGVALPEGQVPGLDCKRLAGVMAWWIPGSRDVVNELSVAPADAFDSVAEAVRLVLEKDPCVEAAPVRVGARGTEVTLAGSVPSADQRRLAELDAWYVFGVDRVRNRMTVHR